MSAIDDLIQALEALKQKPDGTILYAAEVHDLVDGIFAAMEMAGDVTVTTTPIEGGNKITITDPEGVEHEFDVMDGVDGAPGNNGHNPCLGVFADQTALETAHPTAEVGDYAYADVTDSTTQTTTSHIFQYSGSAWVDNGEGSPDNQTAFDGGAGPTVSATKIDDTQLVNPASNALAKAGDVMQLAAKLEGVTLEEVKVTNWADWHPDNETSGYWRLQDGTISWATSSNFCSTRIDIPSGCKAVRFLGFNQNFTTYVPVYGFCDENGDLMTDTCKVYYDASKAVGDDVDLLVDVPEGAAYFVCLYKLVYSGHSYITESKFYIYLRSGDGVKDIVPKVVDNFTDGGADKALSAEAGKGLYDDLFGVTERSVETLSPVNYSWVLGNVGSLPDGVTLKKQIMTNVKSKGLLDYRGRHLIITNRNVTAKAYFAIFAWDSIPSVSSGTEYTLQDLVDNGYLSSIHNTGDSSVGYNGWKALFEVPANGGSVEITVPDDAFSIFATGKINGDSTNRDIAKLEVVTETKVSEGVIDELRKGSGGVSSEDGLMVSAGDINSEGEVVASTTKAVTGFINNGNGFYIELQDGYHVERAVLYDKNGQFVTYNYYVHSTSGHDGTDNNCWGNNEQLPQFMVRLVLAPDTAGAAMPTDGVVKRFVYLNDHRLSRVLPTGVDYAKFLYKLHQLTNIVWRPVEKAQHNYGGSGLNNQLWFLKDSVVTGVPYSTETEYSKYIGIDVAIRTFLTAAKNKRSVIYTECVETSHAKSAYELSYHGQANYTGNFYGSVCTGLTSYLLGYDVNEYVDVMDTRLGSANKVAYGQSTLKWGNNEAVSEEVTIDEFVQRLQPMDIILNPSSHISVISDIYKDEYGVVQFVVWAEQTGPTGRLIPYSKEMLAKRFANKAFELYRLPAATWEAALAKSVEDTAAIVQNNYYDYEPLEVEIDPDITTFEGEYAVFVDNADNDNTESYNNYKAFLNIHRGGVYTTLQIFGEDEDVATATPVTVDIQTNSGTFIDNSTDIYADDAADQDDWIVVDLMQLPSKLAAGKYKARVVGSGVESGFTHFQIVSISMTPTFNGNNVTQLAFMVDGGEAVAVSQQSNLRPYRIKNLTSSEQEQGYVTFAGDGWDASSSYIKLIVRADYGTAVKRINKSSFS